jgi:hypothetical protein
VTQKAYARCVDDEACLVPSFFSSTTMPPPGLKASSKVAMGEPFGRFSSP